MKQAIREMDRSLQAILPHLPSSCRETALAGGNYYLVSRFASEEDQEEKARKADEALGKEFGNSSCSLSGILYTRIEIRRIAREIVQRQRGKQG